MLLRLGNRPFRIGLAIRGTWKRAARCQPSLIGMNTVAGTVGENGVSYT